MASAWMRLSEKQWSTEQQNKNLKYFLHTRITHTHTHACIDHYCPADTLVYVLSYMSLVSVDVPLDMR